MPTAGLSAVARLAAISGPITNTSSSWMASNANALSSVSSCTSSDQSERIDAEIGGIVAPWSAARTTSSQTAAFERMPIASAQSTSEVTAPVTRITCRRPTWSTSRPTKPAVTPTARASAPTTAPICP